MGGCTGTFGMDIFDALAGAAGTYTYYDIYGNLSWGFSQELYQFVASSDCQGYNCLAMTGWNYDVHDFGSASIASGFLADKIAAAEEAAWLNAVFPGSIDTITSYIRVNILMALNQRLNPLDPKIRDQILGNAIAEYVSSTGIGNEWAAYFYGYFSSPILPPH